jgi:hypothetical protein
MNPTMNATAVPEPTTIALLLFVGCLVVPIVLLSKPRTRVAGIVMLVAPLVLAMIAIPFWWLAPGVPQPDPAWQHHATSSGIDFGVNHGGHRNVAVRPTPAVEGPETIVWSESAAAAPAWSTRSDAIMFVLLTVLLLGGLAATVALLAFSKTRKAGIAMIAIGVPAAVLLVGFGLFYVRGAFVPTPARVSMNYNGARSIVTRNAARAAAQRVPDIGIPVESGEKAEVKPVKPAAKPPAGKVEPTGRAAVKTPTAAEKKPAATKTVAEKKPVAEAPAASLAPAKKPPDWVSQPSQMLGDTYQTTIVVGPYTSWQECEDDLPAELQKALNRYVEMHLGQPAGVHPVALPYEFYRDQVVKGKWEEISPSSVGPMNRLYVLLQFDRKVKDRVLDEYRRNVVAGRLWIAGGCLAGVLWLLAVMYGYLRFDLKTGGLYRRRLRFAAMLAILGPVAAALLVVA